ncbi:hypothetical protein [Novosphingobium mangrovi (ex Huang et al. 2023)]|uniref:Uncharacterized protein n=1 Tax=Novosphingobium mangrovi (ex Huang et al. 2023) TaxID=2976432 RepID=A0ABT2HZU8_9SPHN|nr:hypothetical protein [Novosphingobium mangrovi (ex Huang et al. 2023)]MCT2398073.1 hypothetical protein [Novosphingobium mangrovi (ex Huang et al. 2023)]
MRRVVWYFVLAFVAVVVAVVQVDRHSHEVPAYAKFVPSRFANFALIRKAANEVQNGSSKKALADARRLLFVHPVPAENLTILAVAELQNGHQEGGSRALMLAAGRGWREPFAQRAVAVAAAQSEEWEIAADRLTALWKTSSDSPETRETSGLLLENPEIRSHFAARLVGQTVWLPDFIGWAVRNLDSESFVETIEGAGKAGAQLPCEQLSGIARSLLDQGALLLAERLWRNACAAGATSTRGNLAFDNPSSAKPQDPFSWTYPSAAGLTVEVDAATNPSSLNFENTDLLRRVVAQKYLALGAGPHHINVVTTDLQTNEARPILVYFACRGSEANAVFRPITADSRNDTIDVQIPANSCPVQTIELRVAKASAKGLRVIID